MCIEYLACLVRVVLAAGARNIHRGKNNAPCGWAERRGEACLARIAVGAGFKPALPRAVRGAGGACHARLCEAPVSSRYVERYRCEAIQCRE
ncbi:MAG: hypothetical protein LBM98_04945 [Oscillospiraceae bacterium]|nr:hypothetical protein [Oscillospiraceae bacterium]